MCIPLIPFLSNLKECEGLLIPSGRLVDGAKYLTTLLEINVQCGTFTVQPIASSTCERWFEVSTSEQTQKRSVYTHKF